MSLSTTRRRVRYTLPLVLMTALVAAQMAFMPAATAATDFVVTTTSDTSPTAGACGDSSIQAKAPAEEFSLREALCLADNWATNGNLDPINVIVPPGTYQLENGELTVGQTPGQRVTISGAGLQSTTIDGQGLSRILNIDGDDVGSVHATVLDVTFTGGSTGAGGGAAISAGSGPASDDIVAIDRAAFTDNHVTAGVTNGPGGAVRIVGGRATINHTTFTDNSSGASRGGALSFETTSTSHDQTLDVRGSVFTSNETVADGAGVVSGGGAVFVQGAARYQAHYVIEDTKFTNNKARATNGGTVTGAALLVNEGFLTAKYGTFTGNASSGGSTPRGGALAVDNGGVYLQYNRIVGNTATAANGSPVPGGAVWVGPGNNAAWSEYNWWGCNAGPNAAGCDTTAADNPNAVPSAPHLKLVSTTGATTLTGPNATTSAQLRLVRSDDVAIAAADMGAFKDLAPAFSVTGLPGATMSAATFTTGANANSTFSSGPTAAGAGTIVAALDNQSYSTAVTVSGAPRFTSAHSATFVLGQHSSFLVTTSGYPTPSISAGDQVGGFPPGLGWQPHYNGTGTFSGTPTAMGTYDIYMFAQNGVNPYEFLVFKIYVVGVAPAFTSPDEATFDVGEPGSFEVTTTGNPTPALSAYTALPDGLAFVDDGDGTGHLSGTPAPGSGGVYDVGIRAQNAQSASYQTVRLTVNEDVAVTTDPTDQRANAGYEATFTAAASGTPTPTVAWYVSADDGETWDVVPGAVSPTYTISAVEASADNNRYRAVFTNASSSVTTEAAVLDVGTAPTFTSSDEATFAVGTEKTISVTTTSDPVSALTGTDLPAWLTLDDNGDGTGTLTGTAPVGSGGMHTFTLRASNGSPPAQTQTFALTVTEPAAFTSTDAATFTIGEDEEFTVTTRGYDTAALDVADGTLPDDVSFTDNGDGTATLAGTPTVAGEYVLTLEATNAENTATQTFTLTVAKRAQSLNVTSTPATTVGENYDLAAAATSGLTPVYAVSAATTNDACVLTDDDTVALEHAGTCVIEVTQPGNDTYAAAPPLTHSFTVAVIGTSLEVSTSDTATVYGEPVTATAELTASAGTPGGTVQFSLNGTNLGAPQLVNTDGAGATATLALTDVGGKSLGAGAHDVTATFTPGDGTKYASAASNVAVVVVGTAASSASITVKPNTVVADVAVAGPGAGTPTGDVTFTLNGETIGTAAMVEGTATLIYQVPSGATANVAASYAGDNNFTGSSASTARHDPTITAKVTSSTAKTGHGWYRTAVTATFTCTTNGAPLANPCPAPTRWTTSGAAKSVTKTITATDGGAATLVVSGINIDLVKPTVKVTGVRHGGIYNGAAPAATCAGADALSGLASCVLERLRSGDNVIYQVTATDKAGNKATTSGMYEVRSIWLAGSYMSAERWQVRAGKAYTLTVVSTTRPTYYFASKAPALATGGHRAMTKTGTNRWEIRFTPTAKMATANSGYWNLGVKVGTTMTKLRVHVAR